MIRFTIIGILFVLSGCAGAANPYLGATWLATEYIYDKPPLEFVSDFFGKKCKNYSVYEQPAKCRQH